MTHRVDESDEAIIAALQEDGRISFTSIGATVGLSADAVRNRVARLTSEALLKVVGVVDPRSVGINAQAAVVLSCTRPLKEVSQALAEYSEITFLAVLLGKHSLICEISARDDAALADFVAHVVAVTDGVEAAEIWKHLAVHKWVTGLRRGYQGLSAPLGESARPLDALDVALLRILIDDPRRSYAELSSAVDAPYSVVRRRCQDLFDRGVIRAEAVVDRVSTQTLTMATLGLRISGDVDAALASVAAIDQVEILLRVSGRYTAVAEVGCASVAELLSVDDRVRAAAGVLSTEILPYARIEKLPASWAFPDRSTPDAEGG